jgi:hypothetical protein
MLSFQHTFKLCIVTALVSAGVYDALKKKFLKVLSRRKRCGHGRVQ